MTVVAVNGTVAVVVSVSVASTVTVGVKLRVDVSVMVLARHWELARAAGCREVRPTRWRA